LSLIPTTSFESEIPRYILPPSALFFGPFASSKRAFVFGTNNYTLE